MAKRWRGAMKITNFSIPATVVCTAGQFNKLGEYIVKAKELISFGWGNLSGQDNAQGRIYALFQNATPAEVPGILRASIYNPQDQPQKILFELPTEALNSSATNRTLQIPFSDSNVDVTEDMKIVLEFKPDTTATLTTANCKLNMDITQGSE